MPAFITIRRCIAVLVDMAIVVAMSAAVAMLVPTQEAVAASMAIVFFAYATCMERSRFGATIGGKVACLRITDHSGNRPSWKQAATRSAIRLLPLTLICLALLTSLPFLATAGVGMLFADILWSFFRRIKYYDVMAKTVTTGG